MAKFIIALLIMVFSIPALLLFLIIFFSIALLFFSTKHKKRERLYEKQGRV